MRNVVGRPLVIYDGRCAFCRRWIGRWRARTGARVLYAPLQTPLLPRLFGVRRVRAQRAVQLVETNGHIYQGADAVFRLLGRVPGFRLPMRVARLPLLRHGAELVYRLIARNRTLAARVDRLLFGASTEPPRAQLTTRLFLSALGGVYLIAFSSLRAQVLGLYGHRGIAPIRELLLRARALPPETRYRAYPSILWITGASDRTLVDLCRFGQTLAIGLIAGVSPRLTAAALYTLYLSFASVGREFLSYQWDALLLESGLHAIALAPRGYRPRAEAPPWQAVLLTRWLLFRLYLGSGIAKVKSGDPTWRDRSALSYHYATQPLPTPLGWHAHHLPAKVQRNTTIATLAVECFGPFLVFAPRRLRRLGFWLFSGLQAGIVATGNYGFFNLLSAVLGLFALDDEVFTRNRRGLLRPAKPAPRAGLLRRAVTALAGAPIVIVSAVELLARLGRPRPLLKASRLVDALAPLRSINSYGLFSVMTTTRPEIAVEGSNDGKHWEEYQFRYKPTALDQRPRWVAPHQPRLDWQMWFAALDYPPRWFASFLARLLEGSPEVLALLARAPFGDRPPKYVRAVLYQYDMTDRETRRRTGQYWKRTRLGLYLPAIALAPPAEPAQRSAA